MIHKITREDFKQEGDHQWVLNYKQYRVAITKHDGAVDINIHAELTSDPDIDEWRAALRTANAFYEELRIADRKSEE